MEKIITILYGACGLIALLAYLPQIKTLMESEEHRKSLVLSTWAMWTITSGVTFLYAYFVVSDIFFSLVSLVGCICCLIIFLYGIQSRYFNKNI
jgi:hypothetical protein